MDWTTPYPWRSRSDSVRRINMSSEPGSESFFSALRPIPRILSLQRRDCASQVQIGAPSHGRWFGLLTRGMRIARARVAAVDSRFPRGSRTMAAYRRHEPPAFAYCGQTDLAVIQSPLRELR